MLIKIDDVVVGERARKRLGNIEALADSMDELGQLQPIGLDANDNLLFGERRLRAAEFLGWEEIGAVVFDDINDALVAMKMERDENTQREPLSPVEMVEQGRALEGVEREAAKERVVEAGRLGGKGSGKLPDPSTGQSRDKVAAALGTSGRTYEKAKRVVEEGDDELIEAMDKGEVSIHRAHQNLALKYTGYESWYTPEKYLDTARKVIGDFDLDPASCPFAQRVVEATTYYTKEDDGLERHWQGVVWMNPPYTSLVINKFVHKLVEHYRAGDVSAAIMLTNSNTDTSWFHEAARESKAICFTAGRISFYKEDGERSSPTNGQSFFYFGNDVDAFVGEFATHGLVMVKAWCDREER